MELTSLAVNRNSTFVVLCIANLSYYKQPIRCSFKQPLIYYVITLHVSSALCTHHHGVDSVWNVMAHAKKPDFVFRRNRRVHLNRRGRQLGRLLAAEVCASAVVMLDTPRSEVVWRVPTLFVSFPFTSPPVRHRVPSRFNWAVHKTVVTTTGTNHVSERYGLKSVKRCQGRMSTSLCYGQFRTPK
jgi:hypothetical protein